MRRMIAALAAALSVWGCGGSSTSSGDGGGGGGGGGACPTLAGAYSTHWMYVSGGTMCMQGTPSDSTTDGGVSNGVDAGSSCPLVQNGCSYSSSCNSSFGDAGSSQVTFMFTVASDGSVSGTLSSSFSFTFGGQTTMQACAYSFTATKL